MENNEFNCSICLEKINDMNFVFDDIFECISTIKYCATELFIRGFHTASYMCYKKNRYRYLVIDGVSDNSIVVKRILRSKMCMHTYVVSYYFYNYITASVLPHDLLILI